MAIFKLDPGKVKPAAITASVVFLACALFFFSPVKLPHKITLTLASAFIASLWLCPWQISLALLFSALGDYFGSCHIFLAQMGFFAVGHVFYVWFFVHRWLTKVEPDRKLTAKVKGQAMVYLLLVAAILFVAFTKIVPCADAGVIRIGVCVYAVLISAMLFFALMQRSSLYALGAVLFVFSDFILAWNKFVDPIQHSGLLIMTTYYLGQYLLFIRSTPYRVKPGLRIFRF
ncbi:MAG: lysoplasmalogenase [Bacteroidales bacterium]|nr:lysoplasmalogenase [Bacteroidales bacterium]